MGRGKGKELQRTWEVFTAQGILCRCPIRYIVGDQGFSIAGAATDAQVERERSESSKTRAPDGWDGIYLPPQGRLRSTERVAAVRAGIVRATLTRRDWHGYIVV